MGSRWPERVALLAALLTVREARADLALAPGPAGGLGALLVAGPLAAARPGRHASFKAAFDWPERVDASGSGVRLGATTGDRPGQKASWQLATDPSGLLDLRRDLKTQGSEATALAFGVLRVAQPLRGYLALGVDDGVVVWLDGKQVFARDSGRAAHPDDDLIPLDLAPGDHPLMFQLHQRGGAWLVRLRVTDTALAPARGLTLVLPGDIDEARAAEALLLLDLDRRPSGSGMTPFLKVSAPGGWPRGAGRAVSVRATSGGAEFFTVRAGEMPVEEQGPAHGVAVQLPALSSAELGDREARFEAQVGPVRREFVGHPRAAISGALARATQARRALREAKFLKDPEATEATIEALVERLERYAGRGDGDVGAQLGDAAELGQFLDAIERKEDPFLAVRGARRVAYRSPLDGRPSTLGLYVPPGFDPSKKYPLVVALHGMNGKPMNMLRWVFGLDDPRHDGEWEDRHPGSFPDYNAIVIAPMAHFNSFYRYAGEEDVVGAMEWVRRMFPVDPRRVSITGPSMGGTGTAWVAFRYAERFAAAAPLCGYHSYFIRGDMAGKNLRPWERLQAEERSTTHWAFNGLHLPLYVVHGTRDLPVENSGVLIDRYKSLGYSLLEEHPDEGHNVWQPTYEGLQGLRWLTSFTRPANPTRVAFRSNNLRYDRSDWVRLLRLERSLSWGEIFATRKKGKNPQQLEIRTSGVAAFEIDDASLTTPGAERGPVRVKIDGATIEVASEPLRFERRGGAWALGVTPAEGLRKGARLAGPLRDVHHEPTVLVYGTSDPTLARANEEVARWWASIRAGFEIDYPVVSDVEFEPSMAAGKALVLVGGAGSNAVTRRLDGRLPIHVSTSPPEVRVGERRHTGEELGAAFVYPNPDQPGHYVVVIAGVDVPGTLRAMSLPDMLPDYVVYDRRLAAARGQLVLGKAELVEGGLFDERWGLSPGP
jgi:poly(3-hydroxybutyrate) depolymerase